MIAKAPQNGKRGTDTTGLLRYLFGPGAANEHTHPHLIAAWDPEWLAGGVFAELIGQHGGLAKLGRDIDAAMTGHEVDVDGGHVYHVALSVPPADSNAGAGFFGDTLWRELVEEAIVHMGFGPDPDGTGGCRWVAVHHGLSAEGNDHVHLVVNLVRGDGRIANTYRDWPRWREWCNAVEERLDITRTAPAGEGRKATSRPELERAKTAGATDRELLTRVVSDAAAEAHSEGSFLAALEQARVDGAKVLFAPHISGGQVAGYKVALERGDGAEPFWLAGSSLRRDLSLPRLRARWEKPPAIWDNIALSAWTGKQSLATGKETRHTSPRAVRRELAYAETELHQALADSTDPARWHQAVEYTADVTVVLLRFENPPARLHRVHDQLTRAAQRPRAHRQPGVVAPALIKAARLAAVCKDPAPFVLAAVVLLLYGIIKALNHFAEQHHVRAAARERIAAARNELRAHPAVQAEVSGAESGTVVGARPANNPTSSSRPEKSSHQDNGARLGRATPVRPIPAETHRGRSR
ncbi:relaxase/mobilization nuclease domain-containing protein [Amycolatopsis samaneae]|uniref:Relaxase/mobilization nuclease domain-containing protein n=1 Tax=Amycolatopsis samaneae TaxID=664691 RepID=A0ABW5GTN3_9PSEU